MPLTTPLKERKLSDYDVVRMARDMAVDAPADIFSFGVLLYHGLSGTLPLSGNEHVPFYSLRPDLPDELSKVIDRCLQRRFASAHDVGAALEHVMPRLSREALPVTPTVMLSPTEAEPPPPPLGRMLIADDDAAISRLFATLAKRQGIECDTAANGSEAVALLKQREYALMFLDIMMPRIDGWGVLDFLRTRAMHVPALFIVTAFLDQTVSPADSEIVSGIIYKPVDADEIAALMRDCVRGRTPAGVLRNTRHRLIAAAR